MFSSVPFQRQSFVISLTSAMSAILLIAMLALVFFVLRNSSSYFWPDDIYLVSYKDELVGDAQVYARRADAASQATWISKAHYQRNNEVFIYQHQQTDIVQPQDVAEVVLTDGQIMYLALYKLYDTEGIRANSMLLELMATSAELQQRIHRFRVQQLAPLHRRIHVLERQGTEADGPAKLAATAEFEDRMAELDLLLKQLQGYKVEFKYADGQLQPLPISKIERVIFPNQMNVLSKSLEALHRFWLFVSDEPKQANRAGGVFPALFGTVLMVLLMSLIVTPLGILAAIYLHEYAPQNIVTSLVRTCVNNLAGIPSIVFGVFGLGFLVYTLGGGIDQLLFSQDLPNPTFGSPGLFWAALTMALLTLPVVIVSTEEGLRRVPKSLREGSYALGATQLETIRHTVLPIASPGIMTGVILAIARAAGEVAPLILVGAVKFAPALPIDGSFPYLHLDRQFMHLGVMIYDGAFHGQQGGQSSDFMFATCFLLLLIVFTLNLIATFIRSKLRRRYAH